jgi:hypothetical protein
MVLALYRRLYGLKCPPMPPATAGAPLRGVATAVALSCLATTGHAQAASPLKGDITAFEACFIQLMIENPDNPMLDMIGPIVCGERFIPMTQSCDALGYMLFDRRAVCKSDDLVFWQSQVTHRAEAAIAKGRNGTGGLYDDGLTLCDDVAAAGDDPIDCLIEIHWRTALEFVAADLVADLTGAEQ